MQLPFNDNVDPIASGPTTVATTTVESTLAITDEIVAPPDDNALSEAVIVTAPTATKATESVRGTNDLLPAHDSSTLSASTSPVVSNAPEIVSSAVLNSRDNAAINEYQLKAIEWWDPLIEQTRHVRIITQNENGPCPLLAICNILILRGELDILPSDRPTVTTEYLIALLGDKLLETSMTSSSTLKSTDNNKNIVNSVLGLLPKLQYGLDIDLKFSSPRGFVQSDELLVFQAFNIELVHGWCVDPSDEIAWKVLCRQGMSYNAMVELIVQGEDTSKSLADNANARLSMHDTTDEDDGDDIVEIRDGQQPDIVHDALVARDFLEMNATQLTSYGLDVLRESIPLGNLCILFRNNHFATLYKHPDQTLYLLVTDAGLATQNSAVWEVFSDVHGATSELVDATFEARRVIDDYVRDNPDPIVANLDADFALALSLQQQEEEQEQTRRQRDNPRAHESVNRVSNDGQHNRHRLVNGIREDGQQQQQRETTNHRHRSHQYDSDSETGSSSKNVNGRDNRRDKSSKRHSSDCIIC
ncbi:hypothetical protein BDF22DRAFT_681587 [Syncephalis plumigaleata]|nr:hypothetical protein BDF22DRAFT_681587 [Syncephalis plumigaleata]